MFFVCKTCGADNDCDIRLHIEHTETETRAFFSGSARPTSGCCVVEIELALRLLGLNYARQTQWQLSALQTETRIKND